MDFREIFEAELAKRNLKWCKGIDCHITSSHKRGFVMRDDLKTVHYASEIATRKTLHGGLHEIGHCVNDETGMRRFEREQAAESFATDLMREYGIAVPREAVALGKAYVKRMKQWGNNIKRGRSK